MATVFGTLGSIAWGTTGEFVYKLVTTNNAPASFSLDLTADAPETTRFVSGGALVRRYAKGLRSVTGSIVCQLATPQIGNTCDITYASGYKTNSNAFELNIVADNKESTGFGSGLEWKSFTPGLVAMNGFWEGNADDGAALSGAGLDAEPAAITFQLISGGTGKQIGASIITTALSASVSPTDLNKYRYSFVADGQPTVAGTGTLFMDADPGGGVYTITTPETGKTLTLTANTGEAYAGTAHWTSIKLTARVGEPITLAIAFQGSGAWTGFAGV